MTEEYINKTRKAIDFLCAVYNDNIPDIANIYTAQAEEDTKTLLKYLFDVRAYVIKLIDQLKQL